VLVVTGGAARVVSGCGVEGSAEAYATVGVPRAGDCRLSLKCRVDWWRNPPDCRRPLVRMFGSRFTQQPVTASGAALADARCCMRVYCLGWSGVQRGHGAAKILASGGCFSLSGRSGPAGTNSTLPNAYASTTDVALWPARASDLGNDFSAPG
jgi:hypothetical protein